MEIVGVIAGCGEDPTSGNSLSSLADLEALYAGLLGRLTKRLSGTALGLSSINGKRYRGVTQHCRTQKWEAHIWQDGKSVYLGSFSDEHQAAFAHDIAAIGMKGAKAVTNFDKTMYQDYVQQLTKLPNEQLVYILRKQRRGSGRSSSKFRGVTRHQKGKWEARIGAVSGKKYRYLGLYLSEEAAARAYDREAVRGKGLLARTNFPITDYREELKMYEQQKQGGGAMGEVNPELSHPDTGQAVDTQNVSDAASQELQMEEGALEESAESPLELVSVCDTAAWGTSESDCCLGPVCPQDEGVLQTSETRLGPSWDEMHGLSGPAGVGQLSGDPKGSPVVLNRHRLDSSESVRVSSGAEAFRGKEAGAQECGLHSDEVAVGQSEAYWLSSSNNILDHDLDPEEYDWLARHLLKESSRSGDAWSSPVPAKAEVCDVSCDGDTATLGGEELLLSDRDASIRDVWMEDVRSTRGGSTPWQDSASHLPNESSCFLHTDGRGRTASSEWWAEGQAIYPGPAHTAWEGVMLAGQEEHAVCPLAPMSASTGLDSSVDAVAFVSTACPSHVPQQPGGVSNVIMSGGMQGAGTGPQVSCYDDWNSAIDTPFRQYAKLPPLYNCQLPSQQSLAPQQSGTITRQCSMRSVLSTPEFGWRGEVYGGMQRRLSWRHPGAQDTRSSSSIRWAGKQHWPVQDNPGRYLPYSRPIETRDAVYHSHMLGLVAEGRCLHGAYHRQRVSTDHRSCLHSTHCQAGALRELRECVPGACNDEALVCAGGASGHPQMAPGPRGLPYGLADSSPSTPGLGDAVLVPRRHEPMNVISRHRNSLGCIDDMPANMQPGGHKGVVQLSDNVWPLSYHTQSSYVQGGLGGGEVWYPRKPYAGQHEL